MTLTSKVFAPALASPDKVAMTHNGRNVTFRQLAAVTLARAVFARGGVGQTPRDTMGQFERTKLKSMLLA